jgi:hypothetical protein
MEKSLVTTGRDKEDIKIVLIKVSIGNKKKLMCGLITDYVVLPQILWSHDRINLDNR